ncbi:signal peptidase II [Clostridium ganghwense]|uniref:Lipoprotein signal peptidase n=1 Tax=Clostridium ganghwense TaxID=312089 RepID=A0ABT4CMQ9_9CLOT|nr:signal peptidase II [Clostridium ganghwense]MCY6370341.1 signal peptidase II [Clostridium ganghwense]
MEFLVIIIGIFLDRVTKNWALNILKDGSDIEIIKNFFTFQYLENKGAAFGIFQGKILLLTIVTLAVLIGMIFYLFKYKPKSKALRISFALIISGALGNLYDRVIHKYVIDFIMLHYKNVYYFPTFNVADILVVVGTIILAICILKEEE